MTTVGAAWRLLRSEDGKAQAAVLEVLDSVLPTQLKKIILPLLDASPAAEKVRGGRESFEELRAVRPNAPPPWMLGWFGAAASEPLGAALGALCDALARSYPAEQLPSSGGLLPRVVLLRETRLFRGLLALHVAALAQRTHERTVAPGARCCRAGESYVIVSGRARRVVASEDRRGATEYTAGDALNELGCVYAQLPPVHCEAVGAEDGGDGVRLLVLQLAATWPLVVHMPPKFALSLLRALVQMCPPPSPPGGGRQPSAKAITTLQEARRAITDAAADGARASAASAASCRPSGSPTRASAQARTPTATTRRRAEAEAVAAALAAEAAAEGESTDAASDMMVGDERPEAHRVFTRLEKALLLREVKLLRYVDTEYLQSLAEIASERLVPNGTAVCEQGHATDGRLNVIAQGCLALTRARRVARRRRRLLPRRAAVARRRRRRRRPPGGAAPPARGRLAREHGADPRHGVAVHGVRRRGHVDPLDLAHRAHRPAPRPRRAGALGAPRRLPLVRPPPLAGRRPGALGEARVAVAGRRRQAHRLAARGRAPHLRRVAARVQAGGARVPWERSP